MNAPDFIHKLPDLEQEYGDQPFARCQQAPGPSCHVCSLCGSSRALWGVLGLGGAGERDGRAAQHEEWRGCLRRPQPLLPLIAPGRHNQAAPPHRADQARQVEDLPALPVQRGRHAQERL